MSSVSIVIPAFRHAHYIPQTISSVLSQPVPELELIIINDGSPDETAQVIVPFLSDPRVTYLEQDNQGQAAARNRGLALAKGEFIKFLDDDDLLPFGALGWALEYLKSHPRVSAVIGGVQYIDGVGNTIGPFQSGKGRINLEDILTTKYPMASPGQVTFRTQAIREIGGFDASLRNVDDFDLMCRLVCSAKANFENRLALKYRWHGENASSDPAAMYDRARSVIEQYLPLLPEGRRYEVRSTCLAKLEENYVLPLLYLGIASPRHLLSIPIVLGRYLLLAEKILFTSSIWWKALGRRTWHTLKYILVGRET